ncbi:MAG: hypothetical protein AAF693_20425 [Bacteroidota bacterium]
MFEEKPTFISQNTPSSFGTTASGFKVYLEKDGLIRMTLDNSWKYTKVINLDLNSGKVSQKKYEKSIGNCDFVTTNSLIHAGTIYILSICKNYMYLSLRDLQSEKEINSFSVVKDDEIYFKNSGIVQEGGGTIYSKDRELAIKETKKFLAKTSKLTAALP